MRGIDKNKDQSYFLHKLNQEQLSKSLFPIGDLEKSHVRELAEKYNLPNARKKDSQGICFIGKINVQDFLRDNIKPVSYTHLDVYKRQKSLFLVP